MTLTLDVLATVLLLGTAWMSQNARERKLSPGAIAMALVLYAIAFGAIWT